MFLVIHLRPGLRSQKGKPQGPSKIGETEAQRSAQHILSHSVGLLQRRGLETSFGSLCTVSRRKEVRVLPSACPYSSV